MRILVVVTIRNGERYLKKTLLSLLRQSEAADEIICLDNASTDGSAEIVRSVASETVRLFRPSEGVGIAANWNRALDLASGFDLITIAHQDDLYEAEYVASVKTAMQQRPAAFMAHTKATPIDEEDRVVISSATNYKAKFWTDEPLMERPVEQELALLLRGNYIFCPSVTLRTSCLPAIGKFDERFKFVLDWDFWLRGLLSGSTIVGINSPLIRYRIHSASETAIAERSLNRYREEIAVVDKYRDLAGARGLEIRHTAAENTLSDGVLRLLKSGDRENAERLLQFGKTNIPGFSKTPLGMLLSLLAPFGERGSRILLLLRSVYFRMARRPR